MLVRIIAKWKFKYKRKAAPIRMRSNRWVPQCEQHCEICESTDLDPMGKACDEVSADTIQRYFKKIGLFPEEVDIEDNPFEKDDSLDLQQLLTRFHDSFTAEEYISAEDDLEVCGGYIDSSDPNWRETFRDDLLGDNVQELPSSSDISSTCFVLFYFVLFYFVLFCLALLCFALLCFALLALLCFVFCFFFVFFCFVPDWYSSVDCRY